jgi:N-acyl-D-aspartate/D-glutamate deacylase
VLLVLGCVSEPEYSFVLRGGTIYDGSGGEPFVGRSLGDIRQGVTLEVFGEGWS